MQLAASLGDGQLTGRRIVRRHCEVVNAMSQTDCLFCKIVAGEIPCVKIFETEQLLAFLDIAPATPGHTLIVPKDHYATLLDAPASLGTALLDAVQVVGRATMDATGATGFNVLANTFASAGQVVMHAHIHVIPRAAGDGLTPWSGKPYASNEAMQQLAETLRRHIAV